jgi:hypothetical protein
MASHCPASYSSYSIARWALDKLDILGEANWLDEAILTALGASLAVIEA